MAEITKLRIEEQIRLNPDPLTDLFDRLGDSGAETVINRAMEDLAVRLTDLESAFWRGDTQMMRRGARRLVAIADQIGLCDLARVAQDVAACARTRNHSALSATLARLLRIGERSLRDACGSRDLSM